MTANLKLTPCSNSSSGTSNEEESTESGDWKFPLCFHKKRHTEAIEGANTVTQGWRMKERVRNVLFIIELLFI